MPSLLNYFLVAPLAACAVRMTVEQSETPNTGLTVVPEVDEENIDEMLCKVIGQDFIKPDPSWLHRGPNFGADQIQSLCDKPWKPLNAGTKGGSDLFKTADGKLIIKQMHLHEEDTITSMHATEGLGGNGSFITTFYADFNWASSPWGIMPNIFAEGEYVLYDLKGVTTARYRKQRPPFRDPNWVDTYRHSKDGREHAVVGVPSDMYLALVAQLAKDIDLLSFYGAVDYSMLTSVYHEDAVGRISVAGKEVWPMYDFKTKSSKAVLLAGLVDFLEWSFTPRRPQGPETSITRTFIHDPKAYGCRMFWFISTQMLSPCSDVTNGAGCVQDFGSLLAAIFDPLRITEPVNQDFLVTGCQKWSQHYLSLASVVPQLEAFVQQNLG